MRSMSASADRPGESPAPRLEARVRRILQPDLDIDALVEFFDPDRLYLVGRRDDAFGQGEADGEVLEIGG